MGVPCLPFRLRHGVTAGGQSVSPLPPNSGTQEQASHFCLTSGGDNKASTGSIQSGPVSPLQEKTVHQVFLGRESCLQRWPLPIGRTFPVPIRAEERRAHLTLSVRSADVGHHLTRRMGRGLDELEKCCLLCLFFPITCLSPWKRCVKDG